ncbi:hypothetical protein [Flavobacterium johnsoniae]|uniref:hypothetical protein n=1 Tax=Flavobacterium johnsoniae TaxID=986 RepID=UPI0011EEFD45|nr:hypothetical protein [Flavobacterium johnsoniae]
MLYNYDKEDWINIVNQTYDMEFDYLAIDKIGQIAVFSTFNRGYIPECVTSSLEKFSALDNYIETISMTSETVFIKKRKTKVIIKIGKNMLHLGFMHTITKTFIER